MPVYNLNIKQVGVLYKWQLREYFLFFFYNPNFNSYLYKDNKLKSINVSYYFEKQLNQVKNKTSEYNALNYFKQG